MPYAVWLRTMTRYQDHWYKSLQYEDQLNILKLLTYDYESFGEALEWILTNGRDITKKFRKSYKQPCAFLIYEKQLDSLDCLDFDEKNIPDMYCGFP